MGFFSNLVPALLNPFAAVNAATTFGADYLLNQKQNEANKAMWNNQRDHAINMWHMQNEYNTPSAQVQRLREAGLNPNLAYGQVADSKAAAVGLPSQPTMQRASAPRLADYQQVVNMQESNALIRAQRAKTESEAVAAASNAKYTEYENNELMRRGALKTDSVITKTGRAGWGLVKDILAPAYNMLTAPVPVRDRTQLDVDVDKSRAKASKYLGRY